MGVVQDEYIGVLFWDALFLHQARPGEKYVIGGWNLG